MKKHVILFAFLLMFAIICTSCAIGRGDAPVRSVATVMTTSKPSSQRTAAGQENAESEKRRPIIQATQEKNNINTESPKTSSVTSVQTPNVNKTDKTTASSPKVSITTAPKVSITTAPKAPATTAHSHSFGDYITLRQPTETEPGLKMRKCKICGETEFQIIEKLEGGSKQENNSSGNSGNTGSSGGSDGSGDSKSPDSYYQMQRKVLEIVNDRRQASGLPALYYCDSSQSAADLRAKEISTSFSHTRPDGRTCFTVFDDLGISLFMNAENIAYGYRTPEEVMEGWMTSEGHRANIMRSTAKGLSVGIYPMGNGTYYWVQVFNA